MILKRIKAFLSGMNIYNNCILLKINNVIRISHVINLNLVGFLSFIVY